jgi:glycosyltransferase involved in cell wall biosynthesis
MKNDILLSIVVPMYNVAHYLERCLRSLHQQDIPATQYEIICVNDGSPDNCKDIVENLQKEISNIVLINQVNQGVSMARNNAISAAKGKYILPIDPDDYLVQNCLKQALEKIETNNLDVLYCAYEIFDVSGNSVWRTDYQSLEQRIDNGFDGYFAVRGHKARDPDRSWAIFYRASLIKQNQINYPKGVPYLEDGIFLAKVLSVAKLVGYSNQDFYQRTTRPGSATHSNLLYDDKALTGFKKAVDDWLDFHQNLKDKNHVFDDKSLYNQVLAKFVFLGFWNLRKRNSFTLFKEYYEFLEKRGVEKLSRVGVRGVYRKLILYYNLSLKIFYYVLPYRVVLYKRYRF